MITGSNLNITSGDLDNVNLNVGGSGTDVGKYEYPENLNFYQVGETLSYSGSLTTTVISASIQYMKPNSVYFSNEGFEVEGSVFVDGKEYGNKGKIAWHETDERPWGSYEVLLDDPDCKVKKITVNPGEHPSYQWHKHRSELWQIISGYGVVTVDGEEREVFDGSVVRVMKGEKHMIQAFGEKPLIFIEIQRGEYFGEDDIFRVKDKYGRADTKKSKKKIKKNK